MFILLFKESHTFINFSIYSFSLAKFGRDILLTQTFLLKHMDELINFNILLSINGKNWEDTLQDLEHANWMEDALGGEHSKITFDGL